MAAQPDQDDNDDLNYNDDDHNVADDDDGTRPGDTRFSVRLTGRVFYVDRRLNTLGIQL